MKTLFEAIVGSQAYGTNIESSDEDRKQVYQCSNDNILGFKYQEQIEFSKDNVGYEVKRFLELLKSANPTVLELLYSDKSCIISKDPAFDLILKHRDKFLTKNCRNSFGGYAHQQLVKARGLLKKSNWEHEKTEKREPIDFCYVIIEDKTVKLTDWLKNCRLSDYHIGLVNLDHAPHCYAIFFDLDCQFQGIFAENSDYIVTSSVPRGYISQGILVYNRDSYKIHCKDWESYQCWLKERNTSRYIEQKKHGQVFDSKNLMHCRRLLNMAMEIPVEKTLNVRRADKERLLTIRRGEVNLTELIEEAELDLKKLDELYANSDLPDSVDPEFLHDLLLEIRKSY